MSREENHKIWQCPSHTFERQPGSNAVRHLGSLEIMHKKVGRILEIKRGPLRDFEPIFLGNSTLLNLMKRE
jgi:hypothetical protein